MTEIELNDLLDRYIQGECTAQEIAKLESWYTQLAAKQAPKTVTGLSERQLRTWNNLVPKRKGILHVLYAPAFRYAAAIITIIGISATFSIVYYKQHKNTNQQEISSLIKPGGNFAVLTLANGKRISLDTLRNGSVATLPEVLITNDTATGMVTYQIKSSNGKGTSHIYAEDSEVPENTIQTPKGGQYQLLLPDGTHVFLNCASALTFPSRFAANSRKVILTGEAYFEVKHNPNQPFLVTTKGQTTTVLGTHFNVSAYPNEPLITTLAQGSVLVQQTLVTNSSLKQIVLKPNQQTRLQPDGFYVKNVDATDATAWKDGVFIFSKTDLKTVFRQLSRWYNIEVDYSSVPNTTVDAVIVRTLTLNEVLDLLTILSGHHFNLNGRRLSVTK
jgi:hypothetical protein